MVLGANNANLPRIVAIMAEVFSRQAIEADSEVGQRMVTLLKHIQVSILLYPFSGLPSKALLWPVFIVLKLHCVLCLLF